MVQFKLYLIMKRNEPPKQRGITMAIRSTTNGNTTTSYAGMVVYRGYETVQVMSDVWEQWAYAIVFDPIANEEKKIYAGSGWWEADVDACPELMAKYKAFKENERRHIKAVQLWGEHNRNITAAHTLSITLQELKKLNRTYSGRLYEGCWDLLKTKKFRSTFRASLANQLRTWLSEKENKFQYPFSRRQEECVMPYSRW